MVKVVLDSCVIIEKIRTDGGLFDELKNRRAKGKAVLLVSVATILELWAGRLMDKKKEAEMVEHVIEHCKRLVVSEGVAKLAGEIVRKYQTSPMDALIAASAMEDGAQLATLNIKHFVGIKGLKLYNTDK